MLSALQQLSPEPAIVCDFMAACPRPTPPAEAADACSDKQPAVSAVLAAVAYHTSQIQCDHTVATALNAPEQAADASCHHHHQQQQQQHQHQQQQQQQRDAPDQGNGSCDASTGDGDQMYLAVVEHDHRSQDIDQEPDLRQLQNKEADQDDQEDEGMDDDMSVAADDTAATGDQVDGAEPEGTAVEELPNHICMVDGCDVDLSGMKPYFRRSKVCPAHQSAAVVLVNTQQCRFCQQCTRCHPLDDFDGMKRSCRSQLLHHNKSRKHRRRCTPGSFYSSKRVRNNNGVAKKKATTAVRAAATVAAVTNRPAAAMKSAGAAAAALKAARLAAAVQAAGAKAAEAQSTWQRAACSKPRLAAAAAAISSRSAAQWRPAAAAVAADTSSAAAAAMPGYDPRNCSSGSRSRFANMTSYEYNTATAGVARQGFAPHHGLLPQYSADSMGATAATGFIGSQHMLQGFRSLPNPMNPGHSGPSVMSQGFGGDPRARALPPQVMGLGYSSSNPDLGSYHGTAPQHPRFQCPATHASLQNSDVMQHPNMLQAVHELRYNTSPMTVPGSRNVSMTGVMTDQGIIKIEDELNPSCSSCSSKGSPHMPAAGATVGGGAVFSGGRSVTTMQPQQQQQQQQLWQQQQQQQQQMMWQPQPWMQPRDDMTWQQQQQQGVQSSQPAAAAAANTSAGCRKDLYRAFEAVGLPQQLQQQQQLERRHLLQSEDARMYDPGLSCTAWNDAQQPEQQQQYQQQQQQQQQHMPCSGFAAIPPQQQQQQQLLSSGASGRLQLARQLARQVAAAAAAVGAAGSTGPVHTGVRAMLDSRCQQQQRFMQDGFAPQQQAAAMLLQQQHSSPDVSAGSTCAPGAPKQSPQEVHGLSFAPDSALPSTATLGYTVAPYAFSQQQQQQQAAPQQQQGAYGLAAADVVVGIDGYSKGFAHGSWPAPDTAQASLAENPSSNPSDATHGGLFERQSSITLHNGWSLSVPAAAKPQAQQVPSSNPVGYNNLAPGFNSLNPHLMGLDVPALAALVGGCLDSDLEDAWLLDACRSSDDKGGDPLMETLGDLGF